MFFQYFAQETIIVIIVYVLHGYLSMVAQEAQAIFSSINIFSCHIHFIFMSYSFYIHVIFILFSFHTHFYFMSYSFYFHVIIILKYTWHRSWLMRLTSKWFHIDLKTKCTWHQLWLMRLTPNPFHIDLKTKCIWHRFNFELEIFWLEPHEPRTMSYAF